MVSSSIFGRKDSVRCTWGIICHMVGEGGGKLVGQRLLR